MLTLLLITLRYAYFEQFNRDTVDVIDIRDNAIAGFDETGIKLEDGTHYDFDVIVICTGFDVVTGKTCFDSGPTICSLTKCLSGGMTAMGLKDIYGNTLDDQWKRAAYTYLGTTVADYPNMFHLYGPQGPTLLSNGPTTVEVQGRWIADVIKQCEKNGTKYINPTQEVSGSPLLFM